MYELPCVQRELRDSTLGKVPSARSGEKVLKITSSIYSLFPYSKTLTVSSMMFLMASIILKIINILKTPMLAEILRQRVIQDKLELHKSKDFYF